MELTFDLGDSNSPKGHVLVYFRDALDPEKVSATYVVVFPLPVNMAKYVPPFLASSLGGASIADISSFPMPPVPEEVESYSRLLQLAQTRSDDLIYGGTLSSTDVTLAMTTISEVAQRYTEMWSAFDKSESAALTGPEPAEDGLGVSEVMYSLFSEEDRLEELSKLVVRLRFAAETQDTQMQGEAKDELQTLARHLPEDYRADRILEVSTDTSEKGTRLAKLYLDRCYSLSEGDNQKVETIDDEISALEKAG